MEGLQGGVEGGGGGKDKPKAKGGGGQKHPLAPLK